MRVQRVVMPVTGAESWTVVDDGWALVEPVERYLAHLVGAAGACGRLGRRLMLSAVPARSGTVTIWASSWRLFAPSSAAR